MKPLSLKARAIALLSQREHSASELRRKLLRIRAGMRKASEDAGATAAAELAAADESSADEVEAEAEAGAEVDDLLVWLQAQGYLSEARFVESRIHARSARWGQVRIRQELAQHGLALSAEAQAELKSTELERARAVWQRKFGAAVAGAAGTSDTAEEVERDPDEARAQLAKQTRFLTARGFAPDVIRAVLRGGGAD